MGDIMMNIGITHPVEGYMVDILKDHFQNYIELDKKYLIPLTGRPTDLNWREDTFEHLEEIGMSHFGVYKSIRFITKWKNYVRVGDDNQSFKNIYFHFGLIFDNVENLARNIVIVKDYIGIISIDEKLKLSKQTLIEKFEKGVDKKYNQSFKDMKEKGKPIFYNPQHNHNFLSTIVSNRSTRKKYYILAQSLKNYRNYFIHNPGAEIARSLPNNIEIAIRKEYVNNCRHWSHHRRLCVDHPDYFSDPIKLITEDLNETLDVLNQVWNYFIKEMEVIYNHKNFNEIFKEFKREYI